LGDERLGHVKVLVQRGQLFTRKRARRPRIAVRLGLESGDILLVISRVPVTLFATIPSYSSRKEYTVL